MTPEEEYTRSLVPTDSDMLRVGAWIVAQRNLDPEGMLSMFKEACEDGDGRAFQMMVGLGETVIQKLHLREDPEAFAALVKDMADYAANNEKGEKQ